MVFSPVPYVFFRPRDSRTTAALGGSSLITPFASCVCWVIRLLGFPASSRATPAFYLDAYSRIPVPPGGARAFLLGCSPNCFLFSPVRYLPKIGHFRAELEHLYYFWFHQLSP